MKNPHIAQGRVNPTSWGVSQMSPEIFLLVVLYQDLRPFALYSPHVFESH